jgi:hypothetical protein
MHRLGYEMLSRLLYRLRSALCCVLYLQRLIELLQLHRLPNYTGLHVLPQLLQRLRLEVLPLLSGSLRHVLQRMRPLQERSELHQAKRFEHRCFAYWQALGEVKNHFYLSSIYF